MGQTAPRAARDDDDRQQEAGAETEREPGTEQEHELPVAEGPLHDEPASQEAAAIEGEVPPAAPKSPAHAALEPLSKEELIDRHLRLVADLRRIRQRAKQDEDEARREERERVLSSMFEVLDTFERGLEKVGAAGDEDNPWAEGMRAIHRQMLDVLARFGVTPFAPVGEPFDAREHEALSTLPDPERPDGTIAFVERTGYREDDRVLRAARVVVVKNA